MSAVPGPFQERLLRRVAQAGLTLGPTEVERLERYYRLLTKWNARINLTSLELENFPEPTLDRLFVEPLIGAAFVPEEPLAWLDLGSGGGSPAIPLKIVRPQANLTMVDSIAKKGAFLREACRVVELLDVRVTTARIEDLPSLLSEGLADLLTVRAVHISPKVMRTASFLLKRGGRLLHFGANVETLPAGFRFLAREELPSSGDFLMALEHR